MFCKKLNSIDLEEIRKRTELINQYILVSKALEAQKQAYLLSRFSKYGLDMSKVYDIDLKTGAIKESKAAVQK